MGREQYAYGNNYKHCPCGKIIDYRNSYGDSFQCKCCSPRRGLPVVLNDASQVKICIGGTVNGKRYTSCPYYVRGYKVKGNDRIARSSIATLVARWLCGGLCIYIAIEAL